MAQLLRSGGTDVFVLYGCLLLTAFLLTDSFARPSPKPQQARSLFKPIFDGQHLY